MAKVLIVDDAAFMRMMIKDILEKNGFEVVGEANNGLKAVELYKKRTTRRSNYGYNYARYGWNRSSKSHKRI